MAGLAMWTKNEGLVFLAIVLVAWTVAKLLLHGFRRGIAGSFLLAAGALPFNIGGWTPAEGGEEYDGKISNGKLTRTPCECKELATNGVTR